MFGRSLAQRHGDTLIRLRSGLDPSSGLRDVKEMARAASYSRRQFYRLVIQSTSETPAAHRRRLRLDRAAWLLLTTDANILEIALETGWQSHEAFIRAFRERFLLTPSCFRKEQGRRLPWSMRVGFSIALQAQHAEENF